MVSRISMASFTILTRCLRLPLAIFPWAFYDANPLEETFLLVTCELLLCGQALALWRGRAIPVGLPVPLLGFLVFSTLSVWRVANIRAVAFRLAFLAASLPIFATVASLDKPSGRRTPFLRAPSLTHKGDSARAAHWET